MKVNYKIDINNLWFVQIDSLYNGKIGNKTSN